MSSATVVRRRTCAAPRAFMKSGAIIPRGKDRRLTPLIETCADLEGGFSQPHSSSQSNSMRPFLRHGSMADRGISTREPDRPNEAISCMTGSGHPFAMRAIGRQSASPSMVGCVVDCGAVAVGRTDAVVPGVNLSAGTAGSCRVANEGSGSVPGGLNSGCSSSALVPEDCSAFLKNSVMFSASATCRFTGLERMNSRKSGVKVRSGSSRMALS